MKKQKINSFTQLDGIITHIDESIETINKGKNVGVVLGNSNDYSSFELPKRIIARAYNNVLNEEVEEYNNIYPTVNLKLPASDSNWKSVTKTIYDVYNRSYTYNIPFININDIYLDTSIPEGERYSTTNGYKCNGLSLIEKTMNGYVQLLIKAINTASVHFYTAEGSVPSVLTEVETIDFESGEEKYITIRLNSLVTTEFENGLTQTIQPSIRKILFFDTNAPIYVKEIVFTPIIESSNSASLKYIFLNTKYTTPPINSNLYINIPKGTYNLGVVNKHTITSHNIRLLYVLRHYTLFIGENVDDTIIEGALMNINSEIAHLIYEYQLCAFLNLTFKCVNLTPTNDLLKSTIFWFDDIAGTFINNCKFIGNSYLLYGRSCFIANSIIKCSTIPVVCSLGNYQDPFIFYNCTFYLSSEEATLLLTQGICIFDRCTFIGDNDKKVKLTLSNYYGAPNTNNIGLYFTKCKTKNITILGYGDLANHNVVDYGDDGFTDEYNVHHTPIHNWNKHNIGSVNYYTNLIVNRNLRTQPVDIFNRSNPINNVQQYCPEYFNIND